MKKTILVFLIIIIFSSCGSNLTSARKPTQSDTLQALLDTISKQPWIDMQNRKHDENEDIPIIIDGKEKK